MSVEYRAGYWTDVCTLEGGMFVQVTTDGPSVRVFYETTFPTDTLVASEPLMFCRCACVDGGVYSIHQGHDSGKAWLCDKFGHWRELGPTFGVQPVALDSRYAYVVRSNQSYDRIDLLSGETVSLPHGVPGSSQGISDVKDGEIWWADAHRTEVHQGVTFTYPNSRASVTVGQGDPPQCVGLVGPKLFTAFEGDCYEPHLAVNDDGGYAIVARTPRGAAYVQVPPFPSFVGTVPVLPVPDPPKPEPDPVSIPNQLATVQRVRAKYPTPLGDQHGAFLIELAQAVGGFLYKKPGGDHTTLPDGTPVSLDIVIVKAADGPWWVDVLGDAEVNAVPAWDAHPNAEHPENFVDVSGFGAPAPKPETKPDPKPEPPPAQDLSAILKSLEEVRAELSALRSLVADTQSKCAHIESVVNNQAAVVFPDYQGSIPYLGSVRLKPVK